jgi:hypothetical protein
VSSAPAGVTGPHEGEQGSRIRGRFLVRPALAAADWLLACLAFTVLAVLLTWPWAKDMWHGRVSGDAAQFVWDAWWVKERVFGLDNPWWTGALYAPEGTYLTAHPLETLLMVLVSPVTALAGPMVVYGLLVLATIAAAGVLTWHLARAMGLGAVGAWAAGLLWMSSPIVLFRTTTGLYMLLLLAALLPAALILARRLMDGPSVRRALALGLFLGACLLTDLQVTAYLLLAMAALFAYAAATRSAWRSREALTRLAVTAATCLVVGSPVLVMTARAEAAGDYRTPIGARVASATTFNADLAQFLLPSPGSRYFADEYRSAAAEFGDLSRYSIDSSVALGWATIALAAIGILATRRSRRTWWMSGSVVVCALLALGPTFKILGHVYTPLAVDAGEKVSLAAPATLLLGVPVVNDLRIPARYMELGALPLVLLAGLGARTIVRRRRIAGTALVAGLCALAVAEGAVALRAQGPPGERLARIIRDDRRTGIVVDVPLSWRSGIEEIGSSEMSPRAMLQQTIHGKPIAAGYIARLDSTMPQRLLERPLYRSLLLRQGDGVVPPGLIDPPRVAVVADAQRLGAHWVVVWPEADRQVLPYLERIGYHRRAEEAGVLLYDR